MSISSISQRAGLCGLFLSLMACTQNQVAETASIPFVLVDGLVILGTLGTFNPGTSLTVQDLLKKGEINSHADTHAFKEPDWAEVSEAVGTTASQYQTAKETSTYRSSTPTGSSTRYENRGGLVDTSAEVLEEARRVKAREDAQGVSYTPCAGACQGVR
jgi:hypothetical protein